MFESPEEKLEKEPKIKKCDLIDGLEFLTIFAVFYNEDKFEIDEQTKDILIDILNMTKQEYSNEKLHNLPPQDITAALKLFLTNDEEFSLKLYDVSKNVLNELIKTSGKLSKRILRKIETPLDIAPNKISQEIKNISWQIPFASSKKEQDLLFRKQDILFEKEAQEHKKNSKKIDNHIKTCAALSASLISTQYTYYIPVDSTFTSIKNYFSKKHQKSQKVKEL